MGTLKKWACMYFSFCFGVGAICFLFVAFGKGSEIGVSLFFSALFGLLAYKAWPNINKKTNYSNESAKTKSPLASNNELNGAVRGTVTKINSGDTLNYDYIDDGRKLKKSDLKIFKDKLALVCWKDSSENSLEKLLDKMMKEVNKSEYLSHSDEFDFEIRTNLVDNGVRSMVVDDALKRFFEEYKEGISNLKTSSEYQNSGAPDKESMEEEVKSTLIDKYENMRGLDTSLEHLEDGDIEFPTEKGEAFNHISSLVDEIGAENFVLLGEFFTDYKNRLRKIHIMKKGDYKYDDFMKLVQKGVVVRGEVHDVEDFLNKIKVADLKKIGKELGLELKGKKAELIEQLMLKGEEIKPRLPDFFPLRDYFNIRLDLKENYNIEQCLAYNTYLNILSEYIINNFDNFSEAILYGEAA